MGETTMKALKIGMMGAWNTSSGAAIHAELIGRAWVKMGHNLKVFTFYPYSFHGAAITRENEDYVTCCFTTSNFLPQKLDPRPIMEADYDFLVVQDHGMIPNDPLGKIFHWIKKKAKTIAVVHDGRPSPNPSFYQFGWDTLVAFDERYKAFLRKSYPQEPIAKIPYPSHHLVRGDKKKARRKLRLPPKKKIALLFGPAANYTRIVLDPLADAVDKRNTIVLVLTQDWEGLRIFRALKQKSSVKIQLREEVPFTERLYDYLHAADVLLFHKESKPHVVVSSTIHQCLGSGCPILAYHSNFSDYFGDEVIKYSNFQEFREKLVDIFDEGPIYKKSQVTLERFLKNHDGMAVAKRFIKLFNSLKGK